MRIRDLGTMSHVITFALWGGVSEGEERDRKKRAKSLFKEIVAKSFANILERQKKEEDIQVQETQRISNKTKPKRSTPRHIIIKMAKIKGKERTLKAGR